MTFESKGIGVNVGNKADAEWGRKETLDNKIDPCRACRTTNGSVPPAVFCLQQDAIFMLNVVQTTS